MLYCWTPNISSPQKRAKIHAKKTCLCCLEIYVEVSRIFNYDTDKNALILSRYEIIYKQAVTSEDMFLQMGNKTPSTASCEDMLVCTHYLNGMKMVFKYLARYIHFSWTPSNISMFVSQPYISMISQQLF